MFGQEPTPAFPSCDCLGSTVIERAMWRIGLNRSQAVVRRKGHMSKEKEAAPGRAAPTNGVNSIQPQNTAEEPTVKMSVQDMVRKATRDAARDEQYAEEATQDKFNALFDELANYSL